jgi:hypothetical protein
MSVVNQGVSTIGGVSVLRCSKGICATLVAWGGKSSGVKIVALMVVVAFRVGAKIFVMISLQGGFFFVCVCLCVLGREELVGRECGCLVSVRLV